MPSGIRIDIRFAPRINMVLTIAAASGEVNGEGGL
jgi:hypothetical protein